MQTITKEVTLCPESGEVVGVGNSLCSAVSLEPDVQITDSTELCVGVAWGWERSRNDEVLASC